MRHSKDESPLGQSGTLRKKNVRILGSGYAWIGKAWNLNFDSWEGNGGYDEAMFQLLSDFSRKVTCNSVEQDRKISRVTVGLSTRTTELFKRLKSANSTEVMLEGLQYYDSENQNILYISKTLI